MSVHFLFADSPGQKIVMLAPCHTTTPYPPRILMQTQRKDGGLISPQSKSIVYLI